jgi:hypothetical protein
MPEPARPAARDPWACPPSKAASGSPRAHRRDAENAETHKRWFLASGSWFLVAGPSALGCAVGSSLQALKPSSLQAFKPPSPQALKPSSLQALKPSSLQAFKPPSLQALKPPSLQAPSLQAFRPSSHQARRCRPPFLKPQDFCCSRLAPPSPRRPHAGRFHGEHAHCDTERVTHMCCTMCPFFAIWTPMASRPALRLAAASPSASSAYPKTVSPGFTLRTMCRDLEKMRENQNILSSKDFQKQFFLGPLCKSETTSPRRRGDTETDGFWFLVPGYRNRGSGLGIRDSEFGETTRKRAFRFSSLQACRSSRPKTQDSRLPVSGSWFLVARPSALGCVVGSSLQASRPSSPQAFKPPSLQAFKPPSLLSSGLGIRDSAALRWAVNSRPKTRNSKLPSSAGPTASSLQPSAFRSSRLKTKGTYRLHNGRCYKFFFCSFLRRREGTLTPRQRKNDPPRAGKVH